MNISKYMRPPKRDDDGDANKWRGPLFWTFDSPIAWLSKKGPYHEWLKPPGSMTFPICELCRHVVWEWPHFEEAVPENAICGKCAEEEDQANEY